MPDKRTSPIGQPIPRLDSRNKVTGRAIFGADVRLPHMLYARFLSSPHAHAAIVSIDASRAEALPGVRAVITAADIPPGARYNAASRFHAFMARTHVVFIGQPVAAVAADDLATAEAAVELIEVRYRPLPVVATIRDALQPDSTPVLHGPVKGEAGGGASAHTQVIVADDATVRAPSSPNVVDENLFAYGDVEAGFAQAAVIVEHTYTVPVVHQGYIEPHAATAHWDDDRHVTVYEPVQGTWAARELIAGALGLHPTDVTLHSPEVGGAFGGKCEGVFAPIPVLLARKAGRPVQLVVTRQEELAGANPAPHSIIRVKTGARADGTFTAIEADVLLDAGAFPTGWIMTNITASLRDNYRFPAWRMRGREVVTNKPSATSYRAPGAPNLSYAMESQVDELARRLGLDPVTLRRRNLIAEGDLLTNEEPQVTIGAQQVLDALAAHSAWQEPRPARLGADGLLHGRGMALGSWAGSNGPASAIAILEAKGRFRIVIGTVDITGTFTGLAQIAAEALGVSVAQIVITHASPDHAPYAPMSAGSQTIYAMGVAVKEAAEALRQKMVAYVAGDFEVEPQAIGVDEQGLYVVAEPERRHSFAALFRLGTEWFAEYGPLVAAASAPQRQRAPGFAAAVAEVAVDPETGKVLLTGLLTVQDVGKAINPLLIEGQMHGGATQSAGIALWEEIAYDADAQPRNPSLLDYRMPTAADMPQHETVIVEAPGGDGPYGAKLVGEPPIVPALAAIGNAIADATGGRVCDLPITPERVWRALSEGEQ
jgi:CO/xanthine dehydrogenase Mo-binding subunit